MRRLSHPFSLCQGWKDALTKRKGVGAQKQSGAARGGGRKNLPAWCGWGAVLVPAGGRKIWCGCVRCNLDVGGRVGHGVSLGPGARWLRLPMWAGGEGQTGGVSVSGCLRQAVCGGSIVGLPAAGLQGLKAQGCLRQAVCGGSIARLPAAGLLRLKAQGCLRQAVGGGLVEGLPAAGIPLVDGAGLPAAAGLRADCLPAGVGWWFVSDFIWGICPLKLLSE